MAGNEKQIAKFLVKGIGKIVLPHLGAIRAVGAPGAARGDIVEMHTVADVDRLLATEDSRKKADIYINGQGASLKQIGSTFSYNRLQRANLLELFRLLNFSNPNRTLSQLDQEVESFHNQQLERRNRNWQDFFTEDEFKQLTEFLMMKGAPNVGRSAYPAEFILEAPSSQLTTDQLLVYTFKEYFEIYKNKFKIAIRRQWFGQASNPEHNRARSLMRKPENAPWVFNTIAGQPNIHSCGDRWRPEIPANERKTVYFLMIEKER